VVQPAPGSLMVSASCEKGPKTDAVAQKVFARVMGSARSKLTIQ